MDAAKIASEAYTAAPDIGVEESASRAIVRHTDAGLVIAFPGSDNGACWEADFDVLPVAVPGAGQVHSGFLNAWRAISVPVLAAVAGQPVTLIGHSLGAAIALMAAMDMTISGNPPAAVYAFETPRVSPDLTLRTLLADVPLHLFKNGLDIVPDVPFGWQHPGMLTHIGKPQLPFPNVLDHSIQRVIAALTAQ
nr:lipase family protein [Paraburkholderia atlantica]